MRATFKIRKVGVKRGAARKVDTLKRVRVSQTKFPRKGWTMRKG